MRIDYQEIVDKAGVTASNIAKESGVSAPTVSKFLSGDRVQEAKGELIKAAIAKLTGIMPITADSSIADRFLVSEHIPDNYYIARNSDDVIQLGIFDVEGNFAVRSTVSKNRPDAQKIVKERLDKFNAQKESRPKRR
jgi:hypothetical protein